MMIAASLAALLAVLLVAAVTAFALRARSVRSPVEAGTFAGLAAEITALCQAERQDARAVEDLSDEQPVRLAA